MARGGGRVESFYARGMLEIRSTLHLALRLTVRTNQIVEHTGAAVPGAGLWRAVLPLFMVLDVALWAVLRGNDRFGLARRLPLDALDAAFWTMSPRPTSGHAELALLIVIPLAVEAGVRMGWRSLVVPAVVLVATTAGAALVGKPVQLLGVAWIVLAAAVGMAFYRYCAHLVGRAEVERQRFLAAARWRAYLAGQNRVAMGASSAVDVIEGLVPVLGRPPAGSALWVLADGWKSQLSASTAGEVKYLQVALREWERLHNAHPDLSGLVELRVGEGQGTTLLSAPQVRQLRQLLDRLPLRGAVPVELLDAGATHLPGQELRMKVGGRAVVVAADRRASPAPLDPAAVAYLYVAALTASLLLPVGGSLPPGPVVLGVSLCVGAGLLSHRRTVGQGARARLGVFVGAIAVASILASLGAFARQPVNADGVAVVSIGPGMVLLSFLGGFYWRSLGRWRWLVPAAAAGNVVLGLLVCQAPTGLTLRTVLGTVLYNLFPFFPCLHLARALERAAATHAAAVHAVDKEAERAAYLEGTESVIGLVRRAGQDARAQLVALDGRLDVPLARLATDRLEEVERRLRAIET